MVKALPCPHVHAGSALVHQAEQAHPLHARSGGSGGELPPAGSGRAGKRSAARPPRLAGLVSVSGVDRENGK